MYKEFMFGIRGILSLIIRPFGDDAHTYYIGTIATTTAVPLILLISLSTLLKKYTKKS